MTHDEFLADCARHYARQAKLVHRIPMFARMGAAFLALAAFTWIASVIVAFGTLATVGPVSENYSVATMLLAAGFMLGMFGFAFQNEADMLRNHG